MKAQEAFEVAKTRKQRGAEARIQWITEHIIEVAYNGKFNTTAECYTMVEDLDMVCEHFIDLGFKINGKIQHGVVCTLHLSWQLETMEDIM